LKILFKGFSLRRYEEGNNKALGALYPDARENVSFSDMQFFNVAQVTYTVRKFSILMTMPF